MGYYDNSEVGKMNKETSETTNSDKISDTTKAERVASLVGGVYLITALMATVTILSLWDNFGEGLLVLSVILLVYAVTTLALFFDFK